MSEKTRKALQRAIEIVGGQNEMARVIGVTQPAVFDWLKKGVPPKRCQAIEDASGGEVKCHELCPAVFRAPDRAAANGRPRPARAARRPKRVGPKGRRAASPTNGAKEE